MNLENLNLVELNSNEVQEVTGGELTFWQWVKAYHNVNVSIWSIGAELLGELSEAYSAYVNASIRA